METIAAVDVDPLFVGDAGGLVVGAGAAPGVVVLQAAAEVIRLLHVVGDFVELAERDVIDEVPGAAESWVISTPPSLPMRMWSLSLGLIHMAW